VSAQNILILWILVWMVAAAALIVTLLWEVKAVLLEILRHITEGGSP